MRKKKEKTLTLIDIKKILSEVSDFESFWFCNNTVANSLESLSRLLLEVDDTTFRYHLHKNKNDYEDWIKTIIGDEEFSKEISRVKTRITLSKKIQERITFLKEELKRLESLEKSRVKSKKSRKQKVLKEKKVRESKSKNDNKRNNKTTVKIKKENKKIKNKNTFEEKTEGKNKLKLKKIVR